MTATAHDGSDQSSTPYLDAMLRYRDAHFTPFSTPGHKLGKGAPTGLIGALGLQLLQVDIPMAGGIEDTRESTHLLRAAERLAAEAYGADECHFLVNGSTSGVQSLVMTLSGPGDTVIVPRNSHKSLLAGLIFSGAMPCYVEPPIDPLWGIPLNVRLDDVEAAVRAVPKATALFVTSPTYNGFGAHLRPIAALVHAAGLPFVVDQAWGPHFRFCSLLPDDAMSAGADAAVASTHKLISGLTQSSVLMANGGRINLARLASIVKMTQSTSPQTLMYVSIDAARAQMATQGEELWSRALELADWARARINQIEGLRCLGDECLREPGVAAFDATRLTITACDLGHSGWQLESILRDDYRIAVEAADPLNIVLNVTHGDSRQDLERLVSALADYAARYRERAGNATACGHEHLLIKLPPFTRQVLSPRDAFFARSVALPLRECLGRVSAEIVTPYPPGIPVLGPGEEIGPQTVAYLEEARERQLTVHGPEDATLRTLLVVE
jgi:arginine/lysine/ornithine decarboxylase